MNNIETERLLIREFALTDVKFVFELMNTPQYLHNIGDRNIKTLTDAENFLSQKLIKSYSKHGYGLYAVIDKGTNKVIGMSGFVNRDSLPHTDIGFAFLPESMGKGFAYEASNVLMKYAKAKLQLSPILGITSKDNISSQKLLNKLGLKYIKPITLDDEEKEIMLFSSANSWK